ncbi:S-protein homolog 3-like [Salvia miltiorrhiza]|uniref:S-protein homolog 3-like n=1 Tax=Salvia miltiorrhiza TaxID=226208 RepID=UPI0025ABC9DD|nr:S-protein homolog 3-like [Salvia miltiorrhiza]
MMKGVVICLSVSVVLLLWSGCDAYSKTTVSVVNEIADDTITSHCYSGDDDLGYHKLAYKQMMSWSFRYSVIGNTKFICTITTKYGHGSYVAYTEGMMVDRCGLNCVWKVQTAGPCLQQTHDAPWCQSWQN